MACNRLSSGSGNLSDLILGHPDHLGLRLLDGGLPSADEDMILEQVPGGGVVVHTADGTVPAGVPRQDTLFTLAVGRAGAGKTEQEIGRFLALAYSSCGVAYLDFHDAAQRIRPYLVDQAGRVIDLDLGRARGRDGEQIAWNPLDMTGRTAADIERRVDAVVDAVAATMHWDQRNNRALTLLTMATQALCRLGLKLPPDAQPTLFQIATILSDHGWRRLTLAHLDAVTRDFFEQRFPLLEREVTPVTNLIDRLRRSDVVAALLGAGHSGFNLRAAMDTGKIVLISFGGSGTKERLVASLFTQELFSAALSRIDIPEPRRREFHAFIDEAQVLDHSAHLAEMFEQVRKFKLRGVPADLERDERAGQSSLTKTGLRDAIAVADRLIETLSQDGITPDQLTVVCAPTQDAVDTAKALCGQAGVGRAAVPVQDLDPSTWRSAQDLTDRWRSIQGGIEGASHRGTRAVVIVGHDPQVSWLLHYLVVAGRGGQRGAGPLPLGRGELAMLAGPPGKPVLKYVLSPSEDKLIDELQAKIKSKMDSAKLLGTFLTALLVFSAGELAGAKDAPAWYPWAAGMGLVLLAMATSAYFVTMFKYDELLMPVRMWPSPQRSRSKLPRGFVVRPPSSAAWVLYQNMMHVWSNAFVPATVLGGCGSIAVTVALTRPHDLWWLAVASSIAAVLVVTGLVWYAAHPNLGVSD